VATTLTPPPHLCEYARTTIACTAARMVGRHGYTSQDREDIEQDLSCDLLQRLQRFDPARGPRNAFIARRVEAAASNLIRARKVAKRRVTFEAHASLAGDAPASEPKALSDLLVDTAQADERCRENLRTDVAAALAALPADLRRLALALQHGSLCHVVRSAGMSRRQPIRVVFTRCGLAPT
jgi:RNA polymerase sigma-70 factor, ECF subfamily